MYGFHQPGMPWHIAGTLHMGDRASSCATMYAISQGPISGIWRIARSRG